MTAFEAQIGGGGAPRSHTRKSLVCDLTAPREVQVCDGGV